MLYKKKSLLRTKFNFVTPLGFCIWSWIGFGFCQYLQEIAQNKIVFDFNTCQVYNIRTNIPKYAAYYSNKNQKLYLQNLPTS